jgi:membrane peptidoglycan carboxypeptidase
VSPSPGGVALPASFRRYAPTPRQMLWGVLGAFVLLVVLVGIAYATTSIPNPNDTATNQQTFYLYSNGKILAHGGQTNRIDVALKDVPVGVRYAVLSAEDRNFQSEPGISPTGILRAFVTDIRGGDIQQGGSTITQQYVKNAYLSQARTFTRKIKEIFISLKLANSKPKDEILQDYLNTIYFGRNAYGIKAASQAYFGKDVSRLNVSEGAVLAAVIRAPSYYDPSVNKAPAVARWHYVIDGMVKQHWLSAAEAARAQFPTVVKPGGTASNGECVGPTGFICQAVKFDLIKHGFTEARLAAGGYRVFTTIDQTAQKAAVAAENSHNGGYVATGPDKGRESALISVQPGDGAIRAMYGGSQFCPNVHQHPDSCTDLTGLSNNYHRSPGSSFKPYTLIAALQQGISLDSRFPGPPHIDFPGTNGKGISNSQNESCGECTLTQALAKSINTIFVPLAARVGPDKVAQVATDAGIDTKKHKLDPVPTITLGTSDVSPLDQAVGYATIAAQGIEAQPYLVSRVVSADGRVVYRAQKKTHRVFAADVMADTSYAMQQVLASGGTAAGKSLPGRPAAGKTGTNGGVTGNFDAWFIGFTPQLATAVWYGHYNPKHPVTTHGSPLYGGDLPASTWQQMMTGALAGKPVLNFPPPARVGHAINPSPTSSPPSATASATPTTSTTTVPITPTPSITPTHTLPPVVSPSPTPSSSPSGGGGGGGGSPPAGGG